MHANSTGTLKRALAGSLCLLAFVLLFPAQGWSEADAQKNQERLKQAIAGDHREAQNKARDEFRRPYETLTFFDIAPNMTVVEIWPGRGWYSEILAPYLKGSGKLYAASYDKGSGGYRSGILKGYTSKLKGQPEVYDEVIVTELSHEKTDIAPEGSADMVLTFRSVHNWMRYGHENTMFETMYKALKPGGILGVVQHRADPDEIPDPQAKSGYVPEDAVIQVAEAAGFKLVEKSEMNANPKDTRDHPEGVWTLPPSLRLNDKDRDKYLAIGESDRMTLKFVKPKT